MHLIIIDMIPKSKSQSSKAFGFKFDLSHSNIECFLRNPSRPRQQEPSRRPVHTAEHPHREKQEEKKEERREERREQRKGEQEQEPRDLKQSTSPDIVSDLSNSVLKKIEAEGVRHAWQEDEARNAQKEKADSSPEEVSGIWRLPWTFSAQSLSLGSSKKSLQGSEETCLSNPSTARHPQYAYSSGRGMSANMGVVTGAEMGMGAGMGLGAGLGVYGMPSMGHYHCGAERVDNFSVVEDRIEEDGRTTLMVRNIPNKYSLKLVSDEIDASHGDCYDFLYLPFDYNVRVRPLRAGATWATPSSTWWTRRS